MGHLTRMQTLRTYLQVLSEYSTKYDKRELTWGVWHVASQPSSCVCIPSRLACSWTHYPWPSCTDYGTCDSRSSLPLGIFEVTFWALAYVSSIWPSPAYEHLQYPSSYHSHYAVPSFWLHLPCEHEHGYGWSVASWWSNHLWQVYEHSDLEI